MSDSRTKVREESVEVLCSAMQDKHVDAVPASVLVDIMGDILSPAVTLLGSFVVGRRDRDEEVVAVQRRRRRSGADEEETVNLRLSLLALEVLCGLLVRFIPRLRNYPAFDKLWLRVLFVFGSLLGPADATPSPSAEGEREGEGVGEASADPLPDDQVKGCAEEELTLRQEALRRLGELMVAVSGAGVFTEREGLWYVTKESLAAYRGGAAIVAEACSESGSRI